MSTKTIIIIFVSILVFYFIFIRKYTAYYSEFPNIPVKATAWKVWTSKLSGFGLGAAHFMNFGIAPLATSTIKPVNTSKE